MFTSRKLVLIILIAVWALPERAAAKTWRLEKGASWQEMTEAGEDKYLVRVAEIKQLISGGEVEAVGTALAGLKRDFPEIAGADLDAFIEAELLFAGGKYVKAGGAYERFLSSYPESGLYEAALDRMYSIGAIFLGGEKISILKIFKIRGYAEGERIMDRITDRAGDAPIGMRASLAVVKSLEKRRKYGRAYEKWSQISLRWPGGEIGKDALLGMARCKHAGYEGPKYDSSNLISAKSYYENFKLRYPEDAKELDIDGKIRQIEEQMAYKQFEIGRYYEKTGSMQSANLYYQMVLDGWPDSTAAEMVKQKAVKDLRGGQ